MFYRESQIYVGGCGKVVPNFYKSLFFNDIFDQYIRLLDPLQGSSLQVMSSVLGSSYVST